MEGVWREMYVRARWVLTVDWGKGEGVWEAMGMEKARDQRRRSVLIHLSLSVVGRC